MSNSMTFFHLCASGLGIHFDASSGILSLQFLPVNEIFSFIFRVISVVSEYSGIGGGVSNNICIKEMVT